MMHREQNNDLPEENKCAKPDSDILSLIGTANRRYFLTICSLLMTSALISMPVLRSWKERAFRERTERYQRREEDVLTSDSVESCLKAMIRLHFCVKTSAFSGPSFRSDALPPISPAMLDHLVLLIQKQQKKATFTEEDFRALLFTIEADKFDEEPIQADMTVWEPIINSLKVTKGVWRK